MTCTTAPAFYTFSFYALGSFMSLLSFPSWTGVVSNTAGGRMAARQERVLVRAGKLAAARADRHGHDIFH